MSAHPAGVFGVGVEPPPERMEPSRAVAVWAGVAAWRSASVICPILSSSVIRAIRSVTREETGACGFLYKGVVAAEAAGTRAVPDRSRPAKTAARSDLLARRSDLVPSENDQSTHMLRATTN